MGWCLITAHHSTTVPPIQMKFIGIVLIAVGLLAILLPANTAYIVYLKWAERWGQATALGIKVGLIALGAIIYLIGNNLKSSR